MKFIHLFGTTQQRYRWPVKSLGYTPLDQVLKDFDHPKEVIGLVVIDGPVEKIDFRGSNAYEESKLVDAIVLLFEQEATWPPNRTVTNRVHVHSGAHPKLKFHKTHPLMKAFVTGVENQLIRRVIAVGYYTPIGPRWITVPKDKQERFTGVPKE